MIKALQQTAIRRDLRLRQVKVMLAAVVIAVATVATINLFAGHLQKNLMQSASSFLAADRQLIARSSLPVAELWQQAAREIGLKTSEISQFSTMLSSGDAFQLASVKAVDSDYPLRGQIEWQADFQATRQMRQQGPAPGEIWLNPRLLRLLEINVGEKITVGEAKLTVSGLLLREPDSSFSLSAFAPRAMMHFADVPATNVIQPGSRVRHKLLLAGDENLLNAFENRVQPEIDTGNYRWRDARDGDNIGESLNKAENFLLLGGSLAVLLAVVAIAVASREYAIQQRDTVALLKTLGLTSSVIRRLYATRLLLWGFLATLVGLLIAIPFAWLLSAMTAQLMAQPLAFSLQIWTLWPALLTALLVLFAFALPPIDRLRKTPAMQVLRSLPQLDKGFLAKDLVFSGLLVFGLLWLFAGELKLVLSLLAGLAVLLIVLVIFSWLFVSSVRYFKGGSTAWRSAIVALHRHKRATLSQLAVFAMTMMLAATLILVRSSLLADWQAQLPEDAPNHFLVNIAPETVDDVDTFLTREQLQRSPLYPMVRGRLTEINDQPAKEVALNPDDDELQRELNLTAAVSYPDDNKIIAGQWFAEGGTEGLSIEQSLAESLGIKLGDTLGFTAGSDNFSAKVTSIRSVQWESMQPNFFIMFPENGAIRDLPATYLSSFYLDADNKTLLNDFVRQFPTVSVLEIDHIIERIQEIIQQVTQAVEAILVLILLAALAVMVAVVSATMSERQREGALLRTLGAQQKLLVKATVVEFALIGLMAGILGVVAAEAAVWALQYRMFDGTFRWHWPVLIILPLISSVLLALLGRWQLRPVLTVSPMLLLRRLE
ncbi:MAG: FtsX-like permease family protein [Methylophaga sp.]|nr:FtsX-like permease family protein [Methylophaga sp.]